MTKVEIFGRHFNETLIAFLKKNNKIATSALINSIDYRVQKDAENIRIIIEANDYLEYVDQGRKPGKFPNMKAIKDWCNVKGIPQSASFPIARKIFKFGIEPTFVIGQALNSVYNSRPYEDMTLEISSTFTDKVIEELEILKKQLKEDE